MKSLLEDSQSELLQDLMLYLVCIYRRYKEEVKEVLSTDSLQPFQLCVIQNGLLQHVSLLNFTLAESHVPIPPVSPSWNCPPPDDLMNMIINFIIIVVVIVVHFFLRFPRLGIRHS